jgi:ubiquinone/menaquinone biosynthesis C-methylase UbiE
MIFYEYRKYPGKGGVKLSGQESYFAVTGGDAYFQRNLEKQATPKELPGLSAEVISWAQKQRPGRIAVFGGSSGPEAAYLKKYLQDWEITNIDISQEAISSGIKKYPHLNHLTASITAKDLVNTVGPQDCIVLSSILCWIDRKLMTRALLNIDEILKPNGVLAIWDFFPSERRVIALKYAENIFTFKQNYALLFEALGSYKMFSNQIFSYEDLTYPLEDRLCGYALLEKI